MAFDNFTVNVVSFNEEGGVDWTQSRPSVALTITPNAGYAINVADFSPINPLPNYVDSVTFSQSGANIECVILYTSPSVMPDNDVLIALCINGSASLSEVSVAGVVNYYTTFASTGVPSSTAPYNGTGVISSTSEITNLTVIATTGYYFPVLPTASLVDGSLTDYSIVPTLINDAAGNLIQVNFAVNYTFPNYSVTGDRIVVTANAAEIYSPSTEIQSYSMNLANVIVSGETRPITIYGITGAAWQLQVTESVVGTTIGSFSGTIDSSGSVTESVIFPASSVDVVYTFTLTGDLASSFCTTSPCVTGQPSVWQIHQYTTQDVSFNLTSTFSSITVGAADIKSFSALGTPGVTAYSVSAEKPGSSQNFVFDTIPTNLDWSNQNGDFPITEQAVQAPLTIDVNNSSDPKTLVISLNTNIANVGIQSLSSVLDLDNFLLAYTELSLCYALTEDGLCCDTPESRTVFAQGDVANLAGVTGDLYTDTSFQTKAPDGYYSDDSGIDCSAAPVPEEGVTGWLDYSAFYTSGILDNRFYAFGDYMTYSTTTTSVSLNIVTASTATYSFEIFAAASNLSADFLTVLPESPAVVVLSSGPVSGNNRVNVPFLQAFPNQYYTIVITSASTILFDEITWEYRNPNGSAGLNLGDWDYILANYTHN
jgi:hypothetical protein